MVTTVQSSLRQRQHILIRELANCIESYWKSYLSLSAYEIPEDLGYVEGSLSGEKLIIENHCYQTPQFRKLHLELAKVGNSLDILHCVMFPHINYPLPIFGVDIIANKGGIGAAIVDLSPTNRKRILPKNYVERLKDITAVEFYQPRTIPEWGDIFSDFCLFIRPVDVREQQLFLTQVRDFLKLHCQVTISTSPVLSKFEADEIRNAHHYYCSQQQKNDKTRKVLENSLGEAWTERYIKTMLFDIP
ncbi:MAG: phycocyanobilin:ferredoxin oxidoreductase [Rivularia sp. ALOHA_DT_140]|nr:phycocyanobilin:ferredoxin oxidoreductase [Rivularia sp. ALOHA_DT_140]